MEDRNGVVGMTGYEIEQRLEGVGQITIHLAVINRRGDAGTYKRIVDGINNYVQSELSFKTDAFLDDTGGNISQENERNAG